MARKKVVFVIVEGPSDMTALGVILTRLFDKNSVHVEIMHGDITSDKNINSNNIVSKIGDILKSYAASMHLRREHFQQVIHLVDMDGAYIPDSAIIENLNADKPIYSLTEIQSSRVDQMIRRNEHKRSNINRISSLNTVWSSVPYQAFYMSCNLDHALYGNLNSTDEEKERYAYGFAKKYKDDLDGFLTFISDSSFSKVEDFKQSWDFIKDGFHSLERYTNLGICFKEIREERNQKKSNN